MVESFGYTTGWLRSSVAESTEGSEFESRSGHTILVTFGTQRKITEEERKLLEAFHGLKFNKIK